MCGTGENRGASARRNSHLRAGTRQVSWLRNVAAGRLSFTTDLATPVREAQDGLHRRRHARASQRWRRGYVVVRLAARDIAAALNGYTVVVTKSTVPVGEGDEVERIIRETRPDAEFSVVSNPEFLREGAAISDFKRPDRIVIGIEDERAKSVMAELYRPLYLNQAPILFTSRRTAELTKYAANAFLATKITFINEIADLCEKVGANVQEVARGIGLDKRIGSKFLHAGPGYGGSCFPKDTLALIKTAQDHQAPVRIVETVAAVNDQRKRAMGRKVIAACGGTVRNKVVAVLGLTFKPNTDDMRDAPSLAIIATLQDGGARVRAHDPEGMDQARALLPDVAFTASPYEAVADADAVVLVTEWDAFRALDLGRMKAAMRGAVMVDLRNVYRADEVTKHGFAYLGVGQAGDEVRAVGAAAAQRQRDAAA